MFGFLRNRRRRRIREQPFPRAWREIVERFVPYCRALPPADRRELEGHALVLLAEKNFEGCNGLELTDEVRVAVAGNAAVLLLHRETNYYPRCDSILIYPSGYEVEQTRPIGGGQVVTGPEERLGESWDEGVVVVAWDEIRAHADAPDDVGNVILHEFAHQLDQEDGAANGAPILPTRAMDREWARVFKTEFERLQDDIQRNRPTVLDDYGATDPAEFFAVATDTFFTRPIDLLEYHAELYDLLRQYFRQDPAALFER